MESSKNLIIVGDLNEDLLNSNYHNLKNVLIENSLHNIISEPTRGRSLLDPIIIPDDLTTLNSGVLTNPGEISDHSATYVFIPHGHSLSHTYKRTVWLYKRADFDALRQKLLDYDWGCLHNGTVDVSCMLITSNSFNLVKSCIPNKEVTIRPGDKPWYDSEIRKFSRLRLIAQSLKLLNLLKNLNG